MAVNKVIYGGQTLIDITGSTVNANNLGDGVTAYGADGKMIVGNYRGIRFLDCVGSVAANTTAGSYNATILKATDDAVTELVDGMVVAIRIDVAGNSTYGTVLQINNGDKHPIVYNINSAIGTRYGVGSTIIATYNATRTATSYNANVITTYTGVWQVCDYDSTNIYQLRHNAGNYVVSSNLYRYQILFQASETNLIPANSVSNNTGTGKALMSSEFNPFGQILYYNSATTISSGGSVGASTLYNKITVDLRYSFNTGTTLTAHKDVYIKCTPQSNGKVKFATGNPIVQALPTTDDGFVYILLGHSYSTYQIELYPTHPVYEYRQGKVCLYDGKRSSGRNIGEFVESLIPLNDSCLHALDGELLSVGGEYNEAITKIASFVSSNPGLFTTETAWQQSVTTHGICGKFVYTAGKSLRLPKMNNLSYIVVR